MARARRTKRTTDDRVVLQNAVKTLAANIRFTSVDKPIRSILVTSAIPGEGKTTISTQLGAAIVGSGTSAIIVECDMRRRSIASALGVHARHGLYSVLSGRHTLEEAATPTSMRGLYLLDAESGIPNPADLLQSDRFRDLVGRLTRAYGYVIFDTPPVSTFIDAAVVSSLADATVLVVRQDYTRREEVKDALTQLQQAGANVIGTVLNCTNAEVSSKYYNYYKERRGDQSGYEAMRPEGSADGQADRSDGDGYDSASGVRAGADLPEAAPVAAVSTGGQTVAPLPVTRDSSAARPSSSAGSTGALPRRVVRRKRGGGSAHAGGATGTDGDSAGATDQGHSAVGAAVGSSGAGSSAAAGAAGSFSGSPDETMAFLAQTGYAPRVQASGDDE